MLLQGSLTGTQIPPNLVVCFTGVNDHFFDKYISNTNKSVTKPAIAPNNAVIQTGPTMKT